ncbi:MAG: fasciclin domain-containing protein [Acidimicrobiia bacterium]
MRRLLTLAIAMALFAALAVPASARPAWSEKSNDSIVETAIALSTQASSPAGEFDDTAGDFDILIQALVATGVVDLFDGTDYTVFAPTDQAFMDLTGTDNEADAFSAVTGLGLGLDTVSAVLAYHVTDGVRNSMSVTRAAKVTMLDGNTITARGGFVDAIGSDAGFVARPTCVSPTG